mmetsp:Transcript_18589/g.39913  ORF Transcript_18589/g.39913 Transcript_18589/m.39913 type:complete len:387 (-) Transcript_18589:561-1721(-)
MLSSRFDCKDHASVDHESLPWMIDSHRICTLRQPIHALYQHEYVLNLNTPPPGRAPADLSVMGTCMGVCSQSGRAWPHRHIKPLPRSLGNLAAPRKCCACRLAAAVLPASHTPSQDPPKPIQCGGHRLTLTGGVPLLHGAAGQQGHVVPVCHFVHTCIALCLQDLPYLLSAPAPDAEHLLCRVVHEGPGKLHPPCGVQGHAVLGLEIASDLGDAVCIERLVLVPHSRHHVVIQDHAAAHRHAEDPAFAPPERVPDREELGADVGLALHDADDVLGHRGAADHHGASCGCSDACCSQLCGHAPCAPLGAQSAGVSLQGGHVRDLVYGLCIRVHLGVRGVQAVHISHEEQPVCTHQSRDLGRQAVVVAKAQRLYSHRVILINHRDDTI